MEMLGLGTIMIDKYLYSSSYAKLGQGAKIKAIDTRVGGSVVNTARILSQLKVKTNLIVSCGNDEIGKNSYEILTKEG